MPVNTGDGLRQAGEVRAGFAVVADQVRNLAMRAADAAKITANLIETTVKKVKDGSGLFSKTNEAFVRIASTVSNIGELVGEIAGAFKEHSQWI